MTIAKNLKKAAAPKPKREPLWKGPERDGITYSLLSRFLVCRERFRLHVVEGLRPRDQFNARMEFGNMWHACEEAHAATEATVDWQGGRSNQSNAWRNALTNCATNLCTKYPMDQEKISHWHDMTRAMFPLYAEHWSKHPDVTNRTPLLQEQVFDAPYKLPSGRTVRLRGKWDSVDLIGRGKAAGVWLQENKTKSSIDSQKVQRQLTFDLQTMLYLVALENWFLPGNAINKLPAPIQGVRYNVVRRSAHKSVESMLKKLTEDQAAGRIGEWFARWQVLVTAADVARFRRECLDPVLEQLCDWWEFVNSDGDPFRQYDADGRTPCHWRHPFGVYNVLDEGGSSDLDEYLVTGNEVGLHRATELFPELRS